MDDDELLEPSELPGWSRLTIVCHLRYGAEAMAAMIRDTLEGRPASFYPEGRARQRPGTLELRRGETPSSGVRSFVAASAAFDRQVAGVDAIAWSRSIAEPEDNPDLGPIALGTLALLRLTEIEVHATDLGVGASPWSDVFVERAFPQRLTWLESRRSNHGAVDDSVEDRWVFAPDEGSPWVVAVQGGRVAVSPGDEGSVAFRGPRAALLAFLLGRSTEGMSVDGGEEAMARFRRAFPAP